MKNKEIKLACTVVQQVEEICDKHGNKPGELINVLHECQALHGYLPEDYRPDISAKRIHVDQGDCEGCGNCLRRCPNKAIYWNENGLADVDHSICLTCGYCAPVCPVRAIIMW